MAYQRLQVTRALKVHKTNSGIDIPDPDFAGITGAIVTSATNKLTVAAADTFTDKTVQPGYIVENVTTGAYARVAAIDSGTQLTLSSDIFTTAGNIYQIYAKSTRGCILYVGAAGVLNVVTAGGDSVSYVDVSAGSFLPIQVVRVLESLNGVSTDVTNLIAHW